MRKRKDMEATAARPVVTAAVLLPVGVVSSAAPPLVANGLTENVARLASGKAASRI